MKCATFHLSYLLVILIGCNQCSATIHINEYADPIEEFYEKHLHKLVGQSANNENGSCEQFKEYAINDNSNEDIGLDSAQHIISRSGFNYENYYSLASDGYITNLIRLVNPLADRSKLKQPPIMIMHGGIIDQNAYIWASSIQHHPEVYPKAEGEFITSWNRSIGFVLANNGFDVWLVGTRGSNRHNQGHIKYNATKQFSLNMANKAGDYEEQLVDHNSKYWDFSMDEIIEHEIHKQIDKILEVTGAQNVSLLGFSLSSQTSLSFLGTNKEYALNKIHNYVCLAPIVNNIGTNHIMKAFHSTLCKTLPNHIGTALFTGFFMTETVRNVILSFTKSRRLRYSLGKIYSSMLVGPSAKYQTLLEPAVQGHVLMPTGFKELKHYCQQVEAGRLQKFDHGAAGNLRFYGHIRPPAYDISNIHVKNWILISSGNDVLATPSSVQQVLRTVSPEPLRHVHVPHYSHLDLVAAFDNDKTVNMPLLKFFERFHLPPPHSSNDFFKPSKKKFQMLEQFVPQLQSPTPKSFLKHRRSSMSHINIPITNEIADDSGK